jgi:uncharacterized protein YgbK (DUF1537 family)
MRPEATLSGTVGVLADDLTGAMDGGVRLLGAGLSVRVCIEPNELAAMAGETDVLVVDTETRNIEPRRAAARVLSAVSELTDAGFPLGYKKIDSTLRGNLGAELEAVLTSGAAKRVVVAPALPHNGRTTRGGIHYVEGRPLAETEFARDPLAPVEHSRIRDVITEQCPRRTTELGLDDIRGGALPAALSELFALGVQIVVADAETDEDLSGLALAAESAGALPCGSAGWLEAVGRRMSGRSSKDTGRFEPRGGPVLVVSGSPSAVSKEQINRAGGAPGTTVLRLRGATADRQERVSELRRFAEECLCARADGHDVVVDAAGAGRAEIRSLLQDDPREMRRESERVQDLLGRAVEVVLGQGPIAGLVVFGGETALTLCAGLGVVGLDLVGEAEPFVPLGLAVGGGFEGLPVVTKAGGFGTPDVVSAAIRVLRGG